MADNPARPSLSTLAAACRIAAMKIPVGSFWRHTSGDVYEVIGMSIRESTGEVEVVYRPAEKLEEDRYHGLRRVHIGEPDLSGLSFHRPVDEWRETVTIETGGTPVQTERFTAVRRIEIYAAVAA